MMYAGILIQELVTEIRMYREFCQFRIAEEDRRRNQGIDPYPGWEDWIEGKRAVLYTRMRERRELRGGDRGLSMRLV